MKSPSQTVLGENGTSIYFPPERPDAEMVDMHSKLDFNLKYNHWFKLITSFHKPAALRRD
jgi:hypothetical protein